jgi:hypothetical protein
LEAKIARKAGTRDAYKKAILRIFKRRQALAAGAPITASVVGNGTEFVFDGGILCCLGSNDVQISDLYGFRKNSNISIKEITSQLPGTKFTCSNIRLLNYNEEILALLCHDESLNLDYLLAMNVFTGQHVMPARPIENPNRIFVRHTKEVLFFGCHTGTGRRRYREWVVQGISLGDRRFKRYYSAEHNTMESADSELVQFTEFPGSDVGSTVAFKIHDGYFYALSNCSAFDVVEVDWTSFYHCVRFPIFDARRETCEINTRIYRRQHSEGPINDSWTELSLQVDERTDRLLIVEARTEWRSGGTAQTRTFYASEIGAMTSVLNITEDKQQEVGPADDLFSTIPDDESKYSPPQKREPWQFHPEEGHGQDNSYNRGQSSQSFILAHTKFRCYNFTAGTFIDLVQDTCGCRGHGSLCLRLRTGSRKATPLPPSSWIESAKMVKGKGKARIPEVRSTCPSPIPTELLNYIPPTYQYKPVKIWPPDAKSSQVAANHHRIMNLAIRSRADVNVEVNAIADERSLIYLIRPSVSPTGHRSPGKIVCICFDGEASVVERKSLEVECDIQPMPCSTQRNIEDEELKDVGSSKIPPNESLSFEPVEAAWPAYESIWDVYPDAEDLDLETEWLELGWPIKN